MLSVERKHRVQLSVAEIAYTETLVHALRGWSLDAGLIHASQRGRIFSHDEVLNALQTGELIEVNSFGRVLLRSAQGVCVVASIRDLRVITVWFNHPSDQHKTLDLAAYAWKVERDCIREVITEGAMIFSEAYKDGWKDGHADKILGVTSRLCSFAYETESRYWQEYAQGYNDGQREGKVI